MLKKIIFVVALNMIAIHNNIAMETRKAPMRPSIKINGAIMRLNKYGKQIRALDNQLQKVRSDKSNLINDINQNNQDIKNTVVVIGINKTIQSGVCVIAPILDLLSITSVATVVSIPIIKGIEKKNENLANNINSYTLKINASKNALDKINQDENNINSSLTTLKKRETEELIRQLLLEEVENTASDYYQKNGLFIFKPEHDWVIKKTIILTGKRIKQLMRYCGLDADIIRERDQITHWDRFHCQLAIQDNFKGSDSDVMDPNHPEHDTLKSNFFISSDSDISYSEWNCLGEGPKFKENEVRLIIRLYVEQNSEDSEQEDHYSIISGMISAQQILGCESGSDITLEEPSDTGWDSDAIEFFHNYALLTDDRYCA